MGCKASENRWQQLSSNSSGISVEEVRGISTISITASQSGFVRCSATNHRGTESLDKLFVVTGKLLFVLDTSYKFG